MRHLCPRPRRSGRAALATLATLGAAIALAACGTSAASPGGRAGDNPATTLVEASSTTTTTVAQTTTTVDPAGAPLPQPSAAHPMTILEIGDSLGEDLGFGLGDIFASDPWVHVIQGARGDTGLARPDYYNWPAHIETLLQQDHPALLVVFLGANDGQNFVQGSQYASFGGPTWHRLYTARVASVMSEAVAAGTRVLWVGMPIMQDPGFWHEMQQMNTIYQAQAAVHPGAVYVASTPFFVDAHGQYTESLNGVVLRAPDGIHIANGGDDRLAHGLVAPIERNWKVSLFPSGSG